MQAILKVKAGLKGLRKSTILMGQVLDLLDIVSIHMEGFWRKVFDTRGVIFQIRMKELRVKCAAKRERHV